MTSSESFDFWLRANGTIAAARRESPLASRTPAEMVLMAETRKLLRTLLANPRIRICPLLRTGISTALRSRRKLTAPLIPLGPEQRLGWLDELSELTCRLAIANHFTAGKIYQIASRTVPTAQTIQRLTVAGLSEDVLVRGTELLVTIRDNLLLVHVFAHHAPPHDPRIHKAHPLDTLLVHFHIPQVPDIATIFPARFQKLKAQLAAL